jgi:TIR domain
LPVEPPKARVFLSYSRKDAAFTRRLSAALAGRGYAPDYDQSSRGPANIDTGISAEDEWWQRLEEMIAAAETMVIVGSPDLAKSKVCAEEIAHARNLGKRIIPVLFRTIDFDTAPPRLKALNFKIDFTGTDEASRAGGGGVRRRGRRPLRRHRHRRGVAPRGRPELEDGLETNQ